MLVGLQERVDRDALRVVVRARPGRVTQISDSEFVRTRRPTWSESWAAPSDRAFKRSSSEFVPSAPPEKITFFARNSIGVRAEIARPCSARTR